MFNKKKLQELEKRIERLEELKIKEEEKPKYFNLESEEDGIIRKCSND